jgi:hypothetical protein
MKRLALSLLFAVSLTASALAQSAPANLSGQSVYGRLGVPGDTGPGQAIPFKTLAAQLSGVQTANTVYAGPAFGDPAAPAFRAIVGADLPVPGTSSRGGVQGQGCSTHNWFNSLSSGVFGGITISIASPAVVTLNNTFSAGQPVIFSTTGFLPTGLNVGQTYYVIAGGLSSTSFEVSATLGGTAVNTSGGQSGTHTLAAPGVGGVLGCTQPNFSDLLGNIAVSQMNSGTGASSSTFFRGDGTWVNPASALAGQALAPEKVNGICYIDGTTVTTFSGSGSTAALVACPSNSTIVVNSNQTVTANQTISGSNLEILCANGATITYSANVTLTFTGSGIIFRNCTILGQGTGTATTPPIVAQGSAFQFLNNNVSGFGSTTQAGTLQLSGSGALDNVRILGNNFTSIADFSVAIVSSGSIQHLRMTSNLMSNGPVLIPQAGATPTDWVISGNNFEAYGYGGTGIACLEILGGNATIINITITSNTCKLLANGTVAGQNDWAFAGFQAANISSNSYFSSSFHGATGYWPFELNVCLDCIVANNNIATSGSAGSSMVIENANILQVTGNNITGTCTAATCYGIYVLQNTAATFQGANIKNNNVHVTDNTAGAGIVYECNNASANCLNIDVAGNNIVNNTGTAGSKGIWFKNTTSSAFAEIHQGPDNIRAPATGVVVDTGIASNICLTTGFNAAATATSLGTSVVSTCH